MSALKLRTAMDSNIVGTRDTQNKIIDAAIGLFNEAGASSVSSNKIADKAGISKGNLHYHYSSKEEIVLAIWSRMEFEIDSWTDDDKDPTIRQMARMVLRQYRLIWRYRFFYRELNILLEKDQELKYRFERARRQRMEDVFRYFRALAENGVIRDDLGEVELRDLIRISWIVSDFWLSFIAVEDEDVDISTMQEGYRLILQLFRPFLTTQAMQDIPESFGVFSVDE